MYFGLPALSNALGIQISAQRASHDMLSYSRHYSARDSCLVWKEGKDAEKGEWDFKFDGGVEVAFRLDKSIASVFEAAVKRDLDAGFGIAAAAL